MFVSEEAADVKDSAEKVKQALKEAQRAQTAASSAIQQATTDIQNTNNLLTSVSTDPRFQTFTDITSKCRLNVEFSDQNMDVTCLLSALRSGGIRDSRRRVKAEQRHPEAAAARAGCVAAERQSSERHSEHRTDQSGRSEHQKDRRGGQEGEFTFQNSDIELVID